MQFTFGIFEYNEEVEDLVLKRGGGLKMKDILHNKRFYNYIFFSISDFQVFFLFFMTHLGVSR